MPPNDKPAFPTPAPAVEIISNADLMRALIESNKQLAEAMRPKSELEKAGLSPKQIKEATEPPTWIPRFRWIACKSEETGATFEAYVLESRNTTKFPHGRIVGLRGYTRPKGFDVYDRDGGLVPNDMQMMANGLQTPPYKHWLWTTFYQTDLRRYVQRPIVAHLCAPEGDGLKTPWLAGHVRALAHDEDDAA